MRHLIRNVARDTLGVPLTAMAYGNAGRCQAPIGTPAHKRQDGLGSFCQQWLPLSEALQALRPSLLIVTSAELLRRMPQASAQVMTVGVSQRHRVLKGSPWQPADRPLASRAGRRLGAYRFGASR